MSIGQNIKNARKNKGLSQKQLGELLGVSQAAIGQFENEKSTPKLETLEKIAAALNIPVSELIPFEILTPPDPLKQREHPSKYVLNTLQTEQSKLSFKDITLLKVFHSLNNQGQEKAVAYLEDIAGNPKYTK